MPDDPDDRIRRRDRLPDFDDDARNHRGETELGSLAQQSRSKQLKSARNIMYVVAGLLCLGLIIDWTMVDNEIKKAGLDDQESEAVYRIMYVVTGVYIGLIAMYIAFGIFMNSYPVPITITGLVVFIALLLILAALNPQTLKSGILVKIIVIVSLAKSIKSAIAYQKEKEISERQRYDDDRGIEGAGEDDYR